MKNECLCLFHPFIQMAAGAASELALLYPLREPLSSETAHAGFTDHPTTPLQYIVILCMLSSPPAQRAPSQLASKWKSPLAAKGAH